MIQALELMEDPVITTDGSSYERASIEAWFQKTDRDPLTNEIVSSKALVPNKTLKSAIQAAREPDRQRLSVLCIDKRTGQAVYADDRFNGRSALRPDMMVLGCGISGDPARHTIDLAQGLVPSLGQGRREAPDMQLEFTGAPTAPRPPFQASATRSSAATDPLIEIDYGIKKALTIPLPF
jgi:hypothetical protein